MNRFLSSLKKHVWLVTTFVALGGLALSIYQTKLSTKSPILTYYFVRITPEISIDDFITARQNLENNLFANTSDLMRQDSQLNFSEALDKILPLDEPVGALSGGIIVVIENQGEVTAKDIHVNITIGSQVEDYTIISNETFSAVSEDKQGGKINFDIDRLTVGDKVYVAILLPGKYSVTVRLNRIEYVPPVNTSYSQLAATMSARESVEANSNLGELVDTITNMQKYLNGFLVSNIINKIDEINVEVFVSSEEAQGNLSQLPKDLSREYEIFLRVFGK
jgi:hypothetical protein